MRTPGNYALYKGDTLIGVGTAMELSKMLGIDRKCITNRATEYYHRRFARQIQAGTCLYAVKVEP